MPSTVPTHDAGLAHRLMAANRILYKQGVLDAFGHISARHPQSADHFVLSQSKAPALIEAADMLVHDLDSNVAGDHPKLYLERFIHAEIYRSRPDVMSVVHAHSAGSVLFGVTGQRLRPISHMAGFLGSGVGTFEIADIMGDSDLLVSNRQLGEELARSLGPHACVLMRGHGMTVVSSSVEETVFRAIYTEGNAQLQIKAATMGGQARYLTAGEAARTASSAANAVDRAWHLWCHEAGVSAS